MGGVLGRLWQEVGTKSSIPVGRPCSPERAYGLVAYGFGQKTS